MVTARLRADRHAPHRLPAAASDRPVILAQASANRTDETVIPLKSTEGTEYKMELPKGAQV